MKDLPACTECGVPAGEYCRTSEVGALMPYCRARLVDEIRRLRTQRGLIIEHARECREAGEAVVPTSVFEIMEET